ncbi:MAG: acyltransferase [Alphaproteobacteria bacterium]|nr:acyltransferase [Alphaproteobacteria bacterium]
MEVRGQTEPTGPDGGKKRGRLAFLDSLRGVAALYVVAFHLLYVPTQPPTTGNWILTRIADFGGTGVFLFFLISGFSLSLTMPRHDRTTWPAASYAVSRLFRIVPLFYLMLAVFLVRAPLLHQPTKGPFEILVNLLMIFNFFPWKQEGIVWASWTIGVEMLFYVAFLPIFRMRLSYKVAIAAVTAGGFAVFAPIFDSLYPKYALLTYFSVAGFISFFILGMLAHDLYVALERRPDAVRIGKWMAAGGTAALFLILLIGKSGGNVNFRPPIALAYGALLVGCGLWRPRLLEGRPLRFYGKVSYSLYLLHPLVLFHLSPVFRAVLARSSGTAAYVVCLAIAYLAVTVLAAFTYRFVEAPGIRLGAKVLNLCLAWRDRRRPGRIDHIQAEIGQGPPAADRNW